MILGTSPASRRYGFGRETDTPEFTHTAFGKKCRRCAEEETSHDHAPNISATSTVSTVSTVSNTCPLRLRLRPRFRFPRQLSRHLHPRSIQSSRPQFTQHPTVRQSVTVNFSHSLSFFFTSICLYFLHFFGLLFYMPWNVGTHSAWNNCPALFAALFVPTVIGTS